MTLTMTQCTCDSVSQDATLPGFYENPAAFLLPSHRYLTLPLQTALHLSQPSRGQGGSDFAVLPVHLRRRSVTTLRSRSVGEPHPSGWDLSPAPGTCFSSGLPSVGLKDTPTQEDWLVSVLPEGSRVGVDPLIIPTGECAGAFHSGEEGGARCLSAPLACSWAVEYLWAQHDSITR